MKKIISLLILFAFLLFAGVASAASVWSNVYNSTGVSNIAVKVVKKLPLMSGYDLIVAAFNPVWTPGGSGCTVEGGTTSFPIQAGDWFYPNGGVTLNPSQFKMNEVLAYWFGESPDTQVGGGATSGNSPYFTYRWDANSGSGNTSWKLRVYTPVMDDAFTSYGSVGSGVSRLTYREICATSGGSIYVGTALFPRNTTRSLLSGSTVTASTTYWATQQIGWHARVTPYIFVVGK